MKNIVVISQDRNPTGINVGANILYNGINPNENGYRVHCLYHQRGKDYILVDSEGFEKTVPDTDQAVSLVREVVKGEDAIIQSHMYQPFANKFTDAAERHYMTELRRGGRDPLVYSNQYLYVWAALKDPRNNKIKGLAKLLNKVNEKKLAERYKKQAIARYIERWMDMSDRVVYVSNHARRVYSDLYPQYANKSLVIGLGTDFINYRDDYEVEKKARELKRKYGDRANILYAGRITKPKGVGDLIKAFKILNRKYDGFRLVVVGTGDNSIEVDRKSYKLIRNGSIIFPGEIEDRKEMAAWYKNSFVALMPTYHETFSRFAIEAMSMGTPVIISNVDGPKELFVERDIAIGVEPGNYRGIAKAIEHVLINPRETLERSKRALTAVKERFSQESHVKSFMALYDELL